MEPNKDLNKQCYCFVDRYNFKEIEKKWQEKWEKNKTFSTKVDKSKKKLILCLKGKKDDPFLDDLIIKLKKTYSEELSFNVLNFADLKGGGEKLLEETIKKNVGDADNDQEKIFL